MKIFLARHGQTEWNLIGRRQGRLNSALTECGIKQSNVNGINLQNKKIKYIYSSPLGRAKKTSNIITNSIKALAWK